MHIYFKTRPSVQNSQLQASAPIPASTNRLNDIMSSQIQQKGSRKPLNKHMVQPFKNKSLLLDVKLWQLVSEILLPSNTTEYVSLQSD